MDVERQAEFGNTQSSFQYICAVFPHDIARYIFVFVNTQRRLKPFVQWIRECVHYTAKDDVRIELDLTVLGHVM